MFQHLYLQDVDLIERLAKIQVIIFLFIHYCNMKQFKLGYFVLRTQDYQYERISLDCLN
jgi:hypothetical protein